MFCDKCKANIPDTAKYCLKCGTKIGKNLISKEEVFILEIQKLKTQYPEFFEQFSPEFLEFIFSQEMASKIAEICVENEVEDEEKIEKIAYRVTLVLLKQIPKENFTNVLIKGVKISQEIAKAIAEDIEKYIFSQAPKAQPTKEKQIEQSFTMEDKKSRWDWLGEEFQGKETELSKPKEEKLKQEALITPETPKVITEAKTKENKQEVAAEIDKPKDVIICPKCGNANPPTGKFCKKDGTPLKEEIKPAVLPPKVREVVLPKREVKEKVIRRTSRPWLWLTVCVLVLVIAGAGGYLYFSGAILKKHTEVITTPEVTKPTEPEKAVEEEEQNLKETTSPSVNETIPKEPSVDIVGIERNINSAFKNGGLSDVNAKVNNDLEATLKGTVNDPRDKMLASNIAESFRELKGVRNEIVVKVPAPATPKPAVKEEAKPALPPPTPPPLVDFAKLEEQINMALKGWGLSDVYAEVDRDMVATLKGFVDDKEEMAKAINIARSYRELRSVRSNIQVKETIPPPIDIPQLENEINMALKRRGLLDLYAEVDKDLFATLKGFVKDKAEESDAINIAKSYKELRDVRNNIQVKASTKLPKELEAEINNALRSAGFRGVKAYVNDNFEVTLKGIVLSKNNKDLAFRIVRSFKEVKKVYDNIFVGPQIILPPK